MRLGISMRNVDEVIAAYRVDVVSDDIGAVDFTNNLNEMRKMTHADVVSILSVRIGGRPYRVICPADAREKGTAKVSAIDEGGKVVLRGALLVCSSQKWDGDEILVPMTPEDMDHLMERVALVDIGQGDSKYNTYVICDLEVKE